MLLLLAQLVAPPLQDGPVRLPGPPRQLERPSPGEMQPPAPVDIGPLEAPARDPNGKPPAPTNQAPSSQAPASEAAGPLP